MSKRDMIFMKLAEEQHPDGSFGRFHTMDSGLKQKISTTEAAAWLMYDNSITRDNDVCDKTCTYMDQLLNDLSLWPDKWGEKQMV